MLLVTRRVETGLMDEVSKGWGRMEGRLRRATGYTQQKTRLVNSSQ